MTEQPLFETFEQYIDHTAGNPFYVACGMCGLLYEAEVDTNEERIQATSTAIRHQMEFTDFHPITIKDR